MILHIPHASMEFPNTHSELAHKQDIKLIDLYTDEIFTHEFADTIKFKYSRFFCDVERFRNNDMEDMHKIGQGVCYTKYTNGNRFRTITLSEDEHIKKTYYDTHHSLLNKTTSEQLSYQPTVIVVDCHSYDECYTNIKDVDICLGINDNVLLPLVNELIKYFQTFGYKVSINSPFSNALVPTLYEHDTNVNSIMIEVNKKLYLEDNDMKLDSFDTFTQCIQNALNIIKVYEDNMNVNFVY